jgi:hypothetical protein
MMKPNPVSEFMKPEKVTTRATRKIVIEIVILMFPAFPILSKGIQKSSFAIFQD